LRRLKILSRLRGLATRSRGQVTHVSCRCATRSLFRRCARCARCEQHTLIVGLPIRPNRLESYRALSSLDDLSHFHRRLSRPIRWADSSGDVMTTSKRTTRGAGSRPDNGAASSGAPPQSAATRNTAPSAPPQSAAPPSAAPAKAAPASGSPAKARVRQRKSPSSPSPTKDTASPHTESGKAPPIDRYASIAQAAYFRSQHRGFKPGHEMEDWLAAEAEVDQRLRGRVSGDSSG